MVIDRTSYTRSTHRYERCSAPLLIGKDDVTCHHVWTEVPTRLDLILANGARSARRGVFMSSDRKLCPRLYKVALMNSDWDSTTIHLPDFGEGRQPEGRCHSQTQSVDCEGRLGRALVHRCCFGTRGYVHSAESDTKLTTVTSWKRAEPFTASTPLCSSSSSRYPWRTRGQELSSERASRLFHLVPPPKRWRCANQNPRVEVDWSTGASQ